MVHGKILFQNVLKDSVMRYMCCDYLQYKLFHTYHPIHDLFFTLEFQILH